MKKALLSLLMTASVTAATAQQADRFAVTVKVDSAIASVPQKVYLVSYMERELQLHDSLAVDSVHRIGTMHGSVPYEYKSFHG